MNWQKKIITGCLILLSCVLLSCRSAVQTQPTAGTQESEAVSQQVTQKAYQWLCTHQTDIEIEGRLPVLEEMMTFYVLWKNTTDASLKKTYLNEFRKRMDMITSIKDYQVHPMEYTGFLTVTFFAEKLNINTTGFRKIIIEQILPSPYLFSRGITSAIWSTVYLERLGYKCPTNLESLIAQSNFRQEAKQKLLFQAISGPLTSVNIDDLILTTYHITHEIFCLTNFGEYPQPSVIKKNKAFFSFFFDKAIRWTITIENVDLLGELIVCVKMLDIKDVPSLHQGIQYIISRQQDDGSFGVTNPSMPNVYRHGTIISMMALSSFH
jgi:hypothetical protein